MCCACNSCHVFSSHAFPEDWYLFPITPSLSFLHCFWHESTVAYFPLLGKLENKLLAYFYTPRPEGANPGLMTPLICFHSSVCMNELNQLQWKWDVCIVSENRHLVPPEEGPAVLTHWGWKDALVELVNLPSFIRLSSIITLLHNLKMVLDMSGFDSVWNYPY